MSDSSRASDTDHQGRLMLVVDDEPSVRAEEAIATVREVRPELVLLDAALPDRDGFWSATC